MSEAPSPPVPCDLIRLLGHLIRKATPITNGGSPIGFRVTVREFERVRARVRLIESGEEVPRA
jgi:hypothetical protein